YCGGRYPAGGHPASGTPGRCARHGCRHLHPGCCRLSRDGNRRATGDGPMSIAAYVRNAVRRFGPRTALIEGERRWTFVEQYTRLRRLARGLAAKLPAGARIGLFMANRAEYILLQMALERASLVRVPLNARYPAFEVANVVKDCGAQALFFDSA